MFTGIITDVGKVLAIERRGDLRARIATGYDVAAIAPGASIACDGVCLTVIATGTDSGTGKGTGKGTDGGTDGGKGNGPRGWFEVEISAETVARTTIGAAGYAVGTHLNLERALRVGDELGGHIVAGHVDGVAEVLSAAPEGDSLRLRLRAPAALAGFIAPKGSVALNGTSLTVNEVAGAEFGVNLIPHTRAVTTWGQVAAGDRVNLEIDTLARYVARLAEWRRWTPPAEVFGER